MDVIFRGLYIPLYFLSKRYRTNWDIRRGLKNILEAYKDPFIGQDPTDGIANSLI